MLTDFVTDAFVQLALALQSLILPAVFFFALGLITKGRSLFADMRRALRETAFNLQVMVFNLVIVVPLLVVGNQIMGAFFAQPGRQLLSPDTWNHLPAWLVMFLAVFWGDFVGYWRHRLEHSPLLWPSHAVHHSDTEMTWLSLERFHPINRITTFAIDSAAVMMMGFPPEAALANQLVRHYYGFFIHADLPWTYGKLGAIFVSPAMHRWHHCADPRAYHTNYATVFSIFDRAFGTFRVPGPCTAPLGIGGRLPPTLYHQLGYPFRASSYKGLFRKR